MEIEFRAEVIGSMASLPQGNPIPEATQEAKLRLVDEIAHRVWRRESLEKIAIVD